MKYLFISFFLILSLNARGQDSNSEINKLSPFIHALQNFSQNIPQEKVYLHFDNTGYYQDDQIWFKCYVTSGQRQLNDLSKTLYVELLNPGGEIVDKRILKIENGQCYGEFTLNHLPFYSVFYEVRAYTKYMLNFGEDVIFSRLLPVFDKPKEEGNFEEKKMIRYSKWGIRNFPIKREMPEMGKKVNLRFFPEGGNLVQGVASRVAFDATDEIGNPIDVTGVVMDGAKKELCQFASVHEGRGVFTYTPAVVTGRRKDIAEVNYSGKKYQFDLPDALPQGVVMEVDNVSDSESISITLRKNISTPTGTFGIAVLNGGSLQNAYYTNIERDESVFIMEKMQLPSGVSQIVLFNAKGEIICDRLIFSNMNELLTGKLLDIKAKTGKPVYQPYELVDMEISVADREANPVNTSFSLSVRDGENEVDCRQNILTDLLLMSEIKGYVRNPSYYFDTGISTSLNDRIATSLNDRDALNDHTGTERSRSDALNDHTGTERSRSAFLDQLLMVQGWRRYSWKQMAGIEPFEIKNLPEQGIETHGNVVSFVRKTPKPNVNVSMMLTNKKREEDKDGSSFVEIFVTDDQGRFFFVSDVPGKWNMILSVAEKGKSKDHLILLDRVFSPDPKQYRYADMQVNIAEKNTGNLQDEEMIDQVEDDFWTAYKDSIAKLGMNDKVHLISEVTIKGKKNVRDEDILRNRSTSVAYYDVASEYDDIYDRGKYIGDDIHELLLNMNQNFTRKPYSIGEQRCKEDPRNSNCSSMRNNYEYLWYKNNKMALFVVDYKRVRYDIGWCPDEFEYFQYLGVSVPAIKSIYINENPYVIAHYIESCSPYLTPMEQVDINFNCVVFIETYPTNQIPAKGAKGVRKTWLEGYSPVKEFYSPNYSVLPPEPDYRRTLYWNPNVTTDENGKARIEFYNNSRCTNFSISAETVTAEGKIGKYRNN